MILFHATVAVAFVLAQAEPSPLVGLGEELLGFGEVLGVALVLVALLVGLRLWDAIVAQLQRWHIRGADTLARRLPPTRLGMAAVAAFAVLAIVTPAEPAARALVIAGVLVTVLWAGREVLRNLAAGAVVIARQAVRPGDHVQVGEHSGRVRSVTFRGLELEARDGSRTFVPAVMLHTATARHGPGAGRSAATTVTVRAPDLPADVAPDAVVQLVRRLALLSTRRAPGTPVLVIWDDAARLLRITATPFCVAEAGPLEAELRGRVREASAHLAPSG